MHHRIFTNVRDKILDQREKINKERIEIFNERQILIERERSLNMQDQDLNEQEDIISDKENFINLDKEDVLGPVSYPECDIISSRIVLTYKDGKFDENNMKIINSIDKSTQGFKEAMENASKTFYNFDYYKFDSDIEKVRYKTTLTGIKGKVVDVYVEKD